LKYIGDFGFFLFAPGLFDIEKVEDEGQDENVSYPSLGELSILSKNFRIPEKLAQNSRFLASLRASFWTISKLDPA
jgi:hypothetical protein